jgi:apolipoprotein N-acyltransferase
MANSNSKRAGVRDWLAGLLLIGLGATEAAAVCWPFDWGFQKGQPIWWLQTLILTLLYRSLQSTATAKDAFKLTLLFTTSWLCATFWWLYIAMHQYGGLAAVLSGIAVLVLAAALALPYSAACSVWRSLPTSGAWSRTLGFAVLWMAAEMARGTWLTGFGWGAVSYAHTTGPLVTWVPFVGAYGIAALSVWCAASLAEVRSAGSAQRLTLIAVLVLAGLIPTMPFSTPTGTLSATLLQGNIPQDEKFDSGTGVPQALRWYGLQLQRKNSDLVLAPETAIPLLPQDLPEGYLAAMQSSSGKSALMTGIPLGDYAKGYSNSVIAMVPGASEYWRYDKHHLVPFGEFIPPLFKWFTRMMNIPLGDFNRGAVAQPSFEWAGQRIAPNICYEDLFGEELAARFVDPQLAPTIFANVSNLGWFGDSVAIDQHLQISRMRALEFQRPYLRATNTGTTAIMDYQGNVVSSLPRFTVGVLEGTVEGRTGTTPYAWWAARFGLWPLWALAALVVCAILVTGRRSPQP